MSNNRRGVTRKIPAGNIILIGFIQKPQIKSIHCTTIEFENHPKI